ncbi:MAG: hypothetical protein GY909_15585 [Oligoflexia bacterium]|nr:hypothetical protein [Oligoflexia bacterium]
MNFCNNLNCDNTVTSGRFCDECNKEFGLISEQNERSVEAPSSPEELSNIIQRDVLIDKSSLIGQNKKLGDRFGLLKKINLCVNTLVVFILIKLILVINSPSKRNIVEIAQNSNLPGAEFLNLVMMNLEKDDRVRLKKEYKDLDQIMHSGVRLLKDHEMLTLSRIRYNLSMKDFEACLVLAHGPKYKGNIPKVFYAAMNKISYKEKKLYADLLARGISYHFSGRTIKKYPFSESQQRKVWDEVFSRVDDSLFKKVVNEEKLSEHESCSLTRQMYRISFSKKIKDDLKVKFLRTLL